MAVLFCIPTATSESSCHSTFSPAFRVVSVPDFGHSNRYVVLSCHFNFRFPDDTGSIFLYAYLHLYIFFGEWLLRLVGLGVGEAQDCHCLHEAEPSLLFRPYQPALQVHLVASVHDFVLQALKIIFLLFPLICPLWLNDLRRPLEQKQ